MAKKHTYIGSVTGNASQHIVREPSGKLTIAIRTQDTNWTEYHIGRSSFAFDRHDANNVMLKTGTYELMQNLTADLRTATFLHHFLETNHV